MVEADVIIAGAGAAGMNAASILRKAGKTVVVLESRGRLGGRIFSHQLESGTHVELGAQWQAEAGHDRLDQLVKTYGYRKLEHFKAGKDVVWKDGPKPSLQSPGNSGVGCFSGLDFMMRFWRLSRMTKRISLSGFQQGLEEIDNRSVGHYLEKNCWTNGANTLAQSIMKGGFCRDPKDISIYAAGHTMKTFGSLEQQEKAETFFFDQGLQNIFAKMAEELQDGVQLNSRVVEVDSAGDKVVVKASTGAVYTAKELILAFPPQLLGRIRFQPPLPSNYTEVASSMVFGQVLKLIAVFPTPWWRTRGLTGSVSSLGSRPQAQGQEGQGLVLDVSEVADLSHSTGNGVLAGFVVGAQAQEVCERPAEELKKGFADFLRASYGSLEEEIQSFHYHNWISDEDSLGAYMSTPGLGQWKKMPDGFFPKTGRISFAGTEYAHHWRGYMEGALESGERAAHAVLSALTSNS
ncbi:mao [Symbiodinium natans]|uniref:Amine oxidase n=1 Tax=Symbiodinium natans TaxID=878477 RepID=A0A812QYE4_9DINO|nr:mao [Symbiodinium natans]